MKIYGVEIFELPLPVLWFIKNLLKPYTKSTIMRNNAVAKSIENMSFFFFFELSLHQQISLIMNMQI